MRRYSLGIFALALMLFGGTITPSKALADPLPLGVSVWGDCDGNVKVSLTNQEHWLGAVLTPFVTYVDGQQELQSLNVTAEAVYWFKFNSRGGSIVWVGVADFSGMPLSCNAPPTKTPVPPTYTPVPPTVTATQPTTGTKTPVPPTQPPGVTNTPVIPTSTPAVVIVKLPDTGTKPPSGNTYQYLLGIAVLFVLFTTGTWRVSRRRNRIRS